MPRFRYDQLMSFGWKVLVPVATVNLLITVILFWCEMKETLYQILSMLARTYLLY